MGPWAAAVKSRSLMKEAELHRCTYRGHVPSCCSFFSSCRPGFITTPWFAVVQDRPCGPKIWCAKIINNISRRFPNGSNKTHLVHIFPPSEKTNTTEDKIWNSQAFKYYLVACPRRRRIATSKPYTPRWSSKKRWNKKLGVSNPNFWGP